MQRYSSRTIACCGLFLSLSGCAKHLVRKPSHPVASPNLTAAPDRLILSRSLCAVPHFDFSLKKMDAFSWISNHKFIYKREYGDTDHSHSPYSHGIYEHDILTHRTTPNMGFTRALGEGATAIDMRFSPDGRCLIEDRDLSLYYYPSRIVSSDGGVDSFLPTFAANPCWLPDSRRLLLFEPGIDPGVKGLGNQVWLIDIHTPDPITKLSFDPAAIRALKQRGICTSSMTSVTHDRLIADNYVGVVDAAHPVNSLKGVVLQLGRRITLLKTFSVRLPAGMHLLWKAYSPKGDRTLWRLASSSDSKRQSYWISRIDGTDWRELVVLEEDDPPILQSPKWLPDGQHFSFVHNGSLYVADINQL